MTRQKTARYDGVLISPPIFITAINTRGYKKLYPIFKDKTSDTQLVQCDECSRFVSLPGNRSLVKLEMHARSKVCAQLKERHEKWKVENAIRAEAEAALVSTGLVQKLAEPRFRPGRLQHPIVEAETLMSASERISFSIPLRVTSSYSSNSPYEKVLRLSPPPARLSAGSSSFRVLSLPEVSPASINATSHASAATQCKESEKGRQHIGLLVQPSLRSPASGTVSTTEFSSDSDDNSVDSVTNRTTAEESEPDLSDTEIEGISMRQEIMLESSVRSYRP